MAITVTRLTPCFAARIGGADITRPLDDGTWSEIRALCQAIQWKPHCSAGARDSRTRTR